MPILTWQEFDSQGKLHPLYHAEDYIIVVMRPDECTACHWPTGYHVDLGTHGSLDLAKDACEAHCQSRGIGVAP